MPDAKSSVGRSTSDAKSRSWQWSQTLERFGRIDILVHVAGSGREGEWSEVGDQPSDFRPPTSDLCLPGPRRMMAELGAAEFDLLIETILNGDFLCNRAVLSTMIRQRSGQIVNVASVLGQTARALEAA